MNTIRQLCDRCIVLDKGRIVFDGDVEEAISVYYGKEDNLSVVNDCDNTVREPIGDNAMHMRRVEILDREMPILYENEALKLKVNFHSNSDMDRVAFRTIFFTSAGVPVGMAASPAAMHVAEGENEATFLLPLPQLAEGEYYGRVVLYDVNEYGDEIVHDVVNAAFTPTKKEIRNAQRVIAALEEGARNHTGVVVVDGSMVDKPMEIRARTVLAQAEAAGVLKGGL